MTELALKELSDKALVILKGELEEWVQFSAGAQAELAGVSRKIATYWKLAYQEDLGDDAQENAERLLRHAEAELDIVIGFYTIEATKLAKHRAKMVLRIVSRVGLNILKAIV